MSCFIQPAPIDIKLTTAIIFLQAVVHQSCAIQQCSSAVGVCHLQSEGCWHRLGCPSGSSVGGQSFGGRHHDRPGLCLGSGNCFCLCSTHHGTAAVWLTLMPRLWCCRSLHVSPYSQDAVLIRGLHLSYLHVGHVEAVCTPHIICTPNIA